MSNAKIGLRINDSVFVLRYAFQWITQYVNLNFLS